MAQYTIRGIDAIILAIKAGGGYKYREGIQLQDGMEFDSMVAAAEAFVRHMFAKVNVAEKLLQEMKYQCRIDCWEEYQKRIKEIT